MKLKFNIFNILIINKLQCITQFNIINIYTRLHDGQPRSKLIDLPTIYSSEPKVGSLGR